MLIDVTFFSFCCICNYASCYGTGYLSGHNFNSFRSLNDNHGTFILGTGFREKCFVKVSVLVLYLFYYSIYRIPVCMHIGYIHKNGNHQTFIMKIFILVHLFAYDNSSVGRSNDNLFRILSEESDWASEEVYHD